MEIATEEKIVEKPVLGWYRVPNGLMRQKKLRPTEKFLIAGLFEWWNSKGRNAFFYASNKQLADFCGISEPSLIKARARLIESGWIEVKIGTKRSKGIDRLASSYKLSNMLKETVSNTPQCLNTSTLVVPQDF